MPFLFNGIDGHPTSLKIKIAVVGCGAVGSFYGGKLARAGHEVHFLLRSDYEVVKQKGVIIRSPQGDFTIRPNCARRPEEIGRCDLVLIALKSTANEAFSKLLPPLVDEKTVVLTLQNGLGNEEQLAKLFHPNQIMGGLCFVCLNRLEPGVIQHLAHGMVVMGEFSGRPKPRTQRFARTFRHAGIPCKVTANLRARIGKSSYGIFLSTDWEWLALLDMKGYWLAVRWLKRVYKGIHALLVIRFYPPLNGKHWLSN